MEVVGARRVDRIERDILALDVQSAMVETVARVMTLANLSANTMDAFLARLRGNPSGHSRIPDELVIGAGFVLVYPIMMVVLGVMQRRSPVAVFRDFLDSQKDLDHLSPSQHPAETVTAHNLPFLNDHPTRQEHGPDA